MALLTAPALLHSLPQCCQCRASVAHVGQRQSHPSLFNLGMPSFFFYVFGGGVLRNGK